MQKLSFLLVFFGINSLLNAQLIEVRSAVDQNLVSEFNYKLTCIYNDSILSSTSKNGTIDLSLFPCTENVKVEIRHLEYERFDTIINKASNMTIKLESKYKEFEDIVVTGQINKASTHTAIQKIQVIDSTKIQRMGAQNLKDLLSNELNITLSEDPILGSSVSLQGVGGQGVKIMIDGVAVIGRNDGNIDLSQINLQNIERVEIIQGPMAINYGSDAVGGVINLISKKNSDKSTLLSLKQYYESIGQYNSNIDFSSAISKIKYHLNLNRNFFNGWSNDDATFQFEKERKADTNRFKTYKPKTQYQFSFDANRHFEFKKIQLNVAVRSAYFFEDIMNRGMPIKPYYLKAFDDYYLTERIDNNLQISGKLGSKSNISIINAFNHYQRIKNTYYKDLSTLEQQLIENDADQDTSVFKLFSSRATMDYRLSKNFVLEGGYDISLETAFGERILNETEEINDFAAFGSVIFNRKNLNLKAGIRQAHNTVYDAPLLPSINAMWKMKTFTLRSSYAKGFRAPSLKELYLYFVDINHNIQGNENLEAETSNNLQFNISHYKKKGNFKIESEINFFVNHLDNLITLATLDLTTYTYLNIERSKNYGITPRTKISYKNIDVQLGYNYIYRVNRTAESDENIENSNQEILSNLHYKIKKSNTDLSIFYKYNGKAVSFFVDEEGSILNQTSQGFSAMDISVAQTIFRRKLVMTIGIKNVFDNTALSNAISGGGAHSGGTTLRNIGSGRSYFMSLTYKFNFTKK